MLLILDDTIAGKLDAIWEMVKWILAAADEVLRVSADILVLMYVQSFSENFRGTPESVIVARTIFVVIVVGAIAYCLNNLFETFKKFTKPINMRPTLDAVQGPSALQRFMALVLWFCVSIGMTWLGTHLISEVLAAG